MTNRFAVRMLLFHGGERFPVLFDKVAGQPVFDATIYALTELRARNRASSTIDQSARSIMVLQLFLESRGIDLAQRMQRGRVLEVGEIDELVRLCRLPLSAVIDNTAVNAQLPTTQRHKAEPLERVRMRLKTPLAEIAPASAAIRLIYIREYVGWLATGQMLRLSITHPARAALESAIGAFMSAIGARIPPTSIRRGIGQREGLPPEVLTRVLEVTNPNANENPWKGAHVRERNQLVIHLMRELGIRRGELLGLKISDIDFRANTLLIARRADDPADPRRRQPNAKTRDRRLDLGEDLACRLRSYVLGARRNIRGARRHEFLFVANGTGAPMTLEGVTKVFQTLRKKVPGLPDELTGHVLRHTWNDEFSEAIDASNVSEESENNMRSYLMGWSPTSGTAVVV